MLGADLVHARRKGDELVLVPLDAAARARATEASAALLDAARAGVGRPREELVGALRAVASAPRDRRVVDGLRKLVEDGCTFDTGGGQDAPALRERVFSAASAARRAGRFVRAEILGAVAAELGTTADAVDATLFADLRGAERLLVPPSFTAERLVEHWETGQAQSVLLRAVRVEVEVVCRSPGVYRALFRKLKFLRLLHRIEPVDGAYKLQIDGPMSLFDQVTRYGLALALLVPALDACDRFTLRAEVRWGKDRRPLTFRIEGGAGERAHATEAEKDALPDEVQALFGALARAGGPWRAERASAILSVPGAGCCVPDLVLLRDDGARVWLEVLGYWSREAVFRRVDLVKQGLAEPVILAVSERLRVSEEVLGEDLPSALLVFKGAISARKVVALADALAPRERREMSHRANHLDILDSAGSARSRVPSSSA